MLRDEEIERLISYLKGLGVSVRFSSVKDAPAVAECAIDNSEIVVYLKYNKSKTEIILSLLHEAGHAVHHIHEKSRKIDRKMDRYLEKELNKLTKKQRKYIYDDEIASAAYWDIIVKDVNIKLPKWKIDMQKEYDLWSYKYYYQHGNFPFRIIAKEKLKELRTKWRNK